MRLLPRVTDGVDLPYTSERLCHTSPAQSPVCALLVRIPLGPRPWLHRLRSGRTRFVRRLPDAGQGSPNCEPPLVDRETSRFPDRECACMPGSPTTPGRPSTRVGALGHIAFRYTDSVGTRNQFSIAAQWLACAFPCRRFADTLADACARLGG